jgi:probable HAF family extracellular repeat protein
MRWDAAGKPLSLGAGNADAVSGDGTVVAGYDGRAVLWSVGSGGVSTRVIVDNNSAFGLTPDASVAVGGAIFPNVGRTAFRWTAAGGAESLGYLPGHTRYSDANDVSDDGRTVVGYSEGGAVGAEAFRWTAETGMVGLGDLPGGADYSYASSVSADGSLVAGYANDAGGIEYVLWDAAGNIRRLRDVLEDDYGLDLAGWRLTAQNENSSALSFTSALSLSADGRTIVGTGINPRGVREAWVAVVPEPAVLPLLMIFAMGLLRRNRPRREHVG